MDLYFAMTNYQLLECVLHKITMNRENDAIILFSSFLVCHNPGILRDVKKTGFFKDVKVYEETIFSYEEDIDVEKEIEAIRDAVDSKYGNLISKCNNIYVGQDVNSLGVYLVSKGIKFFCLEDACGSYSNPEVLMNIIKDENKNRYDIVKKLKLCGRSEYVIKTYCDFEHQKKDFDASSCVDFSVKRILEKLSKRDLNSILKIYHCQKFNIEGKEKDLLLTWHYNNMGFMTLDEQREFFALLIDYFKNDSEVLFIKPHPSDKRSNYRKWFKDAIVFDRLMPSELLPFCIDDKFKKGITNWSTSIFGLKDILGDVINFDKDIDKTYKDFHKYFAIIKYLDKIKKKDSVKKLILNGINEKQFLQLMRHHIENYERYFQFVSGGDGICILNKYSKNFENKKCIILNGCENFTPQEIIGIKAKDKKECVYLYNLSSEGLFIEKDMKYSGYKLLIASRGVSEYIDYLNDELVKKNNEFEEYKQKKQERIRALKKEVKFHIKQEDLLRNDVNGMLNSSSWKLTEPLRKINNVRMKHGKRKN